MEQREKDPCIFFRSVIQSTTKTKDALNPNGHSRIQLYLDQEQASALIAALQANLENPKGVKLEVNIKKRANQQNGNVFDSGFTFVKAVADTQQGPGAGAPRGPSKFVPKGVPTENTFSRTAKVARELAD